ncbi:MAG: hypothetical protein WAS05_02280 [Candidatus Nanopelagicales bacterium]
MDPYPIRDLATWWNNLDVGAPPTSIEVIDVDQLVASSGSGTIGTEHGSALALVSVGRVRDRESEAASTALVSTALGVNLMELTAPRYLLDGTIDYDAWMGALADSRDQVRLLAESVPTDNATSDQEEPTPLPEPFHRIEQLIIERSQAGLATLLDGPTAAVAGLAAYGRHNQVIDHLRFLCYSPSPLAMRVIEHLRIPAIVPLVVSHVDDTIRQLALETIGAAVNNAENSRLALLADLNPQTEE